MNKVTSRSAQAEETKKKISNAVLNLCTKKDFNAITISEICTAANISTGGFYHHFKSKEDILVWTYFDFDNVLEKSWIKNQSKIAALSPMEKLIFVGLEYYLFLTSQELSYTINAYRSQLLVGNTYVGNRDRYFHNIVCSLCEQWIATGTLSRDWNPEDLMTFILRCIRGLAYDWCSCGGNYDLMKEGERHLQIIFEGLEK